MGPEAEGRLLAAQRKMQTFNYGQMGSEQIRCSRSIASVAQSVLTRAGGPLVCKRPVSDRIHDIQYVANIRNFTTLCRSCRRETEQDACLLGRQIVRRHDTNGAVPGAVQGATVSGSR